MARWDEERGRWEGREHGSHGPRGREERGGWRTDDTWRGGGWREGEERDDWRREERGEARFELGREPGGRAEWDRLRDRESGFGRGAGGRYGAGGGFGRGREPEERDEGGWHRSTQFEPSGEGPGSWGPGGRYGEREWERGRGREYGGFMGGMAPRYGGERYGDEEGRGRWEARSDFGRGSERGYEYRARGDWGRGAEEPGPMERLGERMKEGWRKMTGRGPKGYQRSDERIREDVSERIARSDLDASDVEVKVEHAEVTLTGSVGSRWDKRMLEDLAEEVFGVEEVHNHLRLRRETQVQPGQAAAQTGMSGQTLAGQARPQPGQAPAPDARRH
jgi:BON domain-containing protein